MKEELIRVLNNKLDKINSDIDSLKDLNNKIDEENEKVGFVDGIINLFKDDTGNNPLNFDKIDREDFDRVLDISGDEVKRLFNSSACNYDGLVYLISGIKNGVSISLTNEQMNGIEYLIQTLTNKKGEIDTKINEYNQNKSQYEIDDVNELKTKKDKYENVVDEINKNEYIKDIDLLKEAIAFSNLAPEQVISILSYVLEYNADLFKEHKPSVVVSEPKENQEIDNEPIDFEEEINNDENAEASDDEIEEKVDEETVPEEVADEEIPSDVNSEEKEEIKAEEKEEEPVEEQHEEENAEIVNETIEEEETDDILDNTFHFNQIENDNLFELPNITFDDEKKEEPAEEQHEEENVVANEVENKEYQEFTPVLPNEEVEPVNDTPFTPVETEVKEDTPVVESKEEAIEETLPNEEIAPLNNIPEPEETVSNVNVETNIDSDFKDVINDKKDYEINTYEKEDEKTSTRELHKIFGKYGIEENIVLNELIDGNVNEYQNILDALKDNNILDYIKKNKELLIETLLYSNTSTIEDVLRIVKEDLSVDEEDYGITIKIVINTVPSIFVQEGGNYDNFVKNIQLFKRLGLNLINLFDFSKEIFVADHENIENNLAIVNKYGFEINYKNAKYFLLIPNIEEKLDYYIESVYEDKIKNQTFDGVKYIKDFTAKLNVVTDETIKRLRYASVNGQKVFGNKPGSLSGEITNLKVHALSISDEFMNSFFNNEFTNISSDEVREYVKLVHNSSNVGDYSDELSNLESYHSGLRYTIEGINVSYNKVLRNYNILRSYGIDSRKALQFAVCHNLVITKDEYNKLSGILDRIGGNV